jgi:DNA-binding transcriptional MerR regulator
MKKLAVELDPVDAAVLATPAVPEIPDKLYFRIGEVSGILQVEPYVLRYWESEFTQLAPKKSGSGHRLYRRKDVEMALELKRLLYEKRFTIEGARLFLEQNRKQAKTAKMAAPAKAKAQVGETNGSVQAAVAQPMVTATGQGLLFGGGVPVEALADLRRSLVDLLDQLK